MDEVEVRELRYFIAVAEERNFTRAAARLGMAQPPLSAAIAKLERKIGAMLLERTSRRVTLTPAGAVLLDQARVALDAVTAAVARTRRTATDAESFTVAVKPGPDGALLQQIVRHHARDEQAPSVQPLFGYLGGPAAAVREGAAEAAILRAPFDRRGLDTELLLIEPRVAVLRAEHRLAGRDRLLRADLAGHPVPRWRGAEDPAAAAYWNGTDTAGHEYEAPPGPAINDIGQLLDAVALGDAVAYVPISLADQQRRADLVFIPVEDISPSEVYAAWPTGSRSRMVAAFVRAAVEVAAHCDRSEPRTTPDVATTPAQPA